MSKVEKAKQEAEKAEEQANTAAESYLAWKQQQQQAKTAAAEEPRKKALENPRELLRKRKLESLQALEQMQKDKEQKHKVEEELSPRPFPVGRVQSREQRDEFILLARGLRKKEESSSSSSGQRYNP